MLLLLALPAAAEPGDPEAGITSLVFDKQEPSVYRYAPGASGCRYARRDQHHELTEEDAVFSSPSKAHYRTIRVDVGAFDDHVYHFRFDPVWWPKLVPGSYYDTQCFDDPDRLYNEFEISVEIDPHTQRITPSYLTPCLAGGFQVHEVEYDEDGELDRLAIDFEYRGPSMMGDARGSIRYNASPDLDPEPFDLETVLSDPRRRSAQMRIGKTLATTPDTIDEMDLCTITQQPEAPPEVESSATWNPDPELSPEEVQTLLAQNSVSCIHVLAGSGSVNIWGQARLLGGGEGGVVGDSVDAYCAGPIDPPATTAIPVPRKAVDDEDPDPDVRPEVDPGDDAVAEVHDDWTEWGLPPDDAESDGVGEIAETETSEASSLVAERQTDPDPAAVEEVAAADADAGSGEQTSSQSELAAAEVAPEVRSFTAQLPDGVVPVAWGFVESEEERNEAVQPSATETVVDGAVAYARQPVVDRVSLGQVSTFPRRNAARSKREASQQAAEPGAQPPPRSVAPAPVAQAPRALVAAIVAEASESQEEAIAPLSSAPVTAGEPVLDVDEVLGSLAAIVDRARTLVGAWSHLFSLWFG